MATNQRSLSPNVQLRDAAPADVPAILALIRELAEYERLVDLCVITEAQIHEHLFGPNHVADAFVAETNSAIVSYAIFFRTFSTFLGKPGYWLEDVYVQPAHRHHGIGTAMLKKLAQRAVEHNYGRVEWCVLKWNTPSIGFYEALGATPMDEWQTYRLTGPALLKLATP